MLLPFFDALQKNLTMPSLSAKLTLILSGDDDIFCSESIKAELLPSPDNIFLSIKNRKDFFKILLAVFVWYWENYSVLN